MIVFINFLNLRETFKWLIDWLFEEKEKITSRKIPFKKRSICHEEMVYMKFLTLPYAVVLKTADDKLQEEKDDHTAQQGWLLVCLRAKLDEPQSGQG